MRFFGLSALACACIIVTTPAPALETPAGLASDKRIRISLLLGIVDDRHRSGDEQLSQVAIAGLGDGDLSVFHALDKAPYGFVLSSNI